MTTVEINATFGAAAGERASLSNRALQHSMPSATTPLAHGLKWQNVVALFTKLGFVDHKSENEISFSIGGEHRLFANYHSKDLAAADVMAFRHMLTRAGWSPAVSAKAHVAQRQAENSLTRPDLLLVIELGEARIYQLDLAAADQAELAIRPYDMHRVDYEHDDRRHLAGELSYHGRIARELRTAGRIVVLGHGHGHSSAAQKFSVYIEQHDKDLFRKLILNVVVDLSRLTPSQLLNFGRKFLSERLAAESAT